MYHKKIIPNASVQIIDVGEIALRAFLSTHDEALGHAADLLADRRGARLINAIRDSLNQPGPLTRRPRLHPCPTHRRPPSLRVRGRR